MFIKFGKLKQKRYKGILEIAAYNLHTDTLNMMQPFIKKEDYILDFGCGEGAFSQRLKDNDYQVDACDIDIQQVKSNINNLIQLDFNNEKISHYFSKKYNCIIALEIIEHLENPWKFIRDIKELLKKDGIIVLSTPNISNFASRLRFFMKGTFLAFEKNDLSHGHITPLTTFQLEYLFNCLDLQILHKKAVGTLPIIHFTNVSRFSILRNFVLPLFYPFMGGDKNGRCIAYILKKIKD